MRRICQGLMGLLLLAGCNAPPVERQAEADRFRREMSQLAARLDLDPARPLSLAQCEELALANSLDLRVRELALAMHDERLKLALDSGLPKASLRYDNVQRSNEAAVDLGKFSASFEDRHQQRLLVAAAAPVLDFGVTYYSYQIALDRRAQDRLLLERARQLLRRDVRVAYARHAAAIRQARLADIAYQAAQQVLRVARSLEREDLAVPADTSLVEATVAQAALEQSLASHRVAETHLQLSQLMSLPPGTRFTIWPDLPPLPSAPTAAEVLEMEQQALSNRPELAVQDLERHISANSIRKEFARFFPSLDLTGSFNWSNSSIAANPAYFLYGFSVAHSLLDGGSQIWRYELARKAATVQEQQALLLALGVVYEVEFRALRLAQALETAQAAAELERARKAALDRIISLYREGLEDEAGAARALADLTSQTTVLDRAQAECLVAAYELEASVMPGRPLVPTTQPATRPGFSSTVAAWLDLGQQKASMP